jgi:hypothetical protein
LKHPAIDSVLKEEVIEIPIMCLKDAELYQVSCLCAREHQKKHECDLCKNKMRITPLEVFGILSHFVSTKSDEFDLEWTINAYAHTVWKLNAF